jgi:hypothetical protein
LKDFIFITNNIKVIINEATRTIKHRSSISKVRAYLVSPFSLAKETSNLANQGTPFAISRLIIAKKYNNTIKLCIKGNFSFKIKKTV